MRLTKRQYQVYDLIQSRVNAGLPPPTVREIMEDLGSVNPEAAKCHVRVLLRKGAIRMVPKSARSITIPGHKPGCFRLPVMEVERRSEQCDRVT